MTLDRLLEDRHLVLLEWSEPWPALGPEGNELTACVTYRATVHDCINMARLVAKQRGWPIVGNDAEHLFEFMTIHWAREVE